MRKSEHLTAPLLFLCLVSYAAPFFTALEDSSVWDANEAFYVQTPREMLERPSWLIPYFNGEPRLNKPPLSYWIVGGLYQLFGVDLFWERAALAVFAYASVLLLFWLGRLHWDGTVAVWAAGIFATTFRFVLLSRRLLIDILLLFFLLAAVGFFLRWAKTTRPFDFVIASLFLGLGCLAKGPVALLPALLLFVYVLFSGRLKTLFSAPLLPSGAVFVVVSTSWYILVGLFSGWDSVTNFFLRENLGRFSHLDYGPERGYLYYAGVFLADFFPWSVLFIAGVVWWARKGRLQIKESDRTAMRWLLLWILLWIVTFSLSRNKQEYYILPVYPAAALFVASCLRNHRFSGWVAGLVGAALLATGLVLALVGLSLFPDAALLWLPALLLLPAPWLALRRRWTAVILSTCFFYASAFAVYLEPLERYRPIQSFARLIQNREAGKHRHYMSGYYRLASPSLAFYLNQPILELSSPHQAARYLNSETTVYLVVDGSDYDGLQQAVGRQLWIVEARPRLSRNAGVILSHLLSGQLSARDWTRPVYLISNRDPSED